MAFGKWSVAGSCYWFGGYGSQLRFLCGSDTILIREFVFISKRDYKNLYAVKNTNYNNDQRIKQQNNHTKHKYLCGSIQNDLPMWERKKLFHYMADKFTPIQICLWPINGPLESHHYYLLPVK